VYAFLAVYQGQESKLLAVNTSPLALDWESRARSCPISRTCMSGKAQMQTLWPVEIQFSWANSVGIYHHCV